MLCKGIAIPKDLMAEFARFSLAWRFHIEGPGSEWHLSLSEMSCLPQIDVLYLTGPNTRRRELFLAKLLIAHHDLFVFPVAVTNRPPFEGEIDGLHYAFRSEMDFNATKSGLVVQFTDDEFGGSHGMLAKYGYPLEQLKSKRLEGRVAVISSPGESTAYDELAAKEAAEELCVAQVYFDVAIDATPAGQLFERNPDAWDRELKRRMLSWDHVIPSDLSDDAAFKDFEAYLEAVICHGKRKHERRTVGKRQSIIDQSIAFSQIQAGQAPRNSLVTGDSRKRSGKL